MCEVCQCCVCVSVYLFVCGFGLGRLSRGVLSRLPKAHFLPPGGQRIHEFADLSLD